MHIFGHLVTGLSVDIKLWQNHETYLRFAITGNFLISDCESTRQQIFFYYLNTKEQARLSGKEYKQFFLNV